MSQAIAAMFVGLLLAAGLGATPTSVAGDHSRVCGAVEYLLWWIKDSPAAPLLVSTGTLADPGVSVLLGGKDIGTGDHYGGRFTLGVWLTQARDLGLEASYFVLLEISVQHRVSSSGRPGSQDLFIPLFDVTRPGERWVGELGRWAASRMRRAVTGSTTW